MIYTWNVQIDALFHLPFSDLRSNQYSLSRYEISRKSRQNDRVSIATQQLFIQLQIGEWEMREGIKMHISYINFVAILWELRYLIPARNVDFWGGVFCGNLFQRISSESEPDAEPKLEFESVGNTNDNNITVYALEKIKSFARDNWYIVVAQCVWWLASIVGLHQG
jgi:hypothetical protein